MSDAKTIEFANTDLRDGDIDKVAEDWIYGWNVMEAICHKNALDKGFWDDEKPNISEKLMLIVSEIGECCEAIRHNNPPSEKISFSHAEEEIADAIVRIMSLAAYMKWNIAPALVEKMKINIRRPYKHNKEF